VSVVPDGVYDVFVVDASTGTEDGESVVHLVLTLLDGPHKGEVVELGARGLDADELDLLGTPAVLHVEHGRPRVRFEG
jgi:hypothetical protein